MPITMEGRGDDFHHDTRVPSPLARRIVRRPEKDTDDSDQVPTRVLGSPLN